MTPVPGSVVRTRRSFSRLRGVPSATATIPAWIELPMPTPPPWCTDLAPRHKIVDALAELGPLAVAQPADARRQALVRHALARETDPARERAVFGKELEHEAIRPGDVRRVT